MQLTTSTIITAVYMNDYKRNRHLGAHYYAVCL